MLENRKRMIKIVAIITVLFIILYIIIGLWNSVKAASEYNQSVRSGIDAFPEDYQVYLRQLQADHPNWTFDAYYTGIDWNELVSKETDHGHNRIINSANSLWKCNCGNVATGYACASADIVKYYMDPRNFLGNDVKIFQFLEISFNDTIHTVDGIKSVIKGTFMADKKMKVNVNGQEKEMSYEEIILESARQSNMSPYSIATKIIQEVGSKGSGSVTGTYEGYEGYYNFFNYAASDGGSPIAKALEYAKNGTEGQSQEKKDSLLLPWTDPYRAIVGGAKLLASSYTNAGQNTAYFYKWDVVGDTVLKAGSSQTISQNKCFNHQYMTNIQDPTSQTTKLYNTYVNANIIDAKLNFVIPVYNNMPKANKLPTTLTKNDGTLYYMNNTGVRVRKEPTTSASIIATMNTLDEIVAVQVRKCANANGHDWDKVKLASGIEGYIASEYLSPCEEEEQAVIESGNVKAIPNTTVKSLVAGLGITSYEVTKDGNRIDDSNKIGTGYKLKDTSNNKEYTLVVMGDINGDAEINSGDLLLTKKYLLGTMNSTDIQKQAMNLNKDAEINSGDLLQMKKYLLGSTELYL